MFRPILVSLMLMASSAAAQASLLQSARDAYEAAWMVSPLSVESVTFVERRAELIGDVVEREDTRFSPGEEILIYAEPWGYDYIETRDGFQFGFDLDLEVLDSTGESLYREDGFQAIRMSSKRAVKELFLTVALDLDGFRAGEYQILIRANDIASDETAEFMLPFEIEE